MSLAAKTLFFMQRRAFFVSRTQTMMMNRQLMMTPLRAMAIFKVSDIDHHDFQNQAAGWNVAYTMQHIAYQFRKNEGKIYDRYMAWAMMTMVKQDLELTEEFWRDVFPVIKETVTQIDKESVDTLADFVEYAGELGIQDNEFWASVETKIIDDRLHRYFKLEQIAQTLNGFAEAGRGSDELLDVLEKHVVKHRKALTEGEQRSIKKSYTKFNRGSEALFRALEEPDKKLEQLAE